MSYVKVQEQLDEMTTQMAEMKASLTASTTLNETLQTSLATAKTAEEARDKADAAKIHLEEVTAKCAGLGLTEEVIASFAALDEQSFGVVLAEVSGRQTKLDEALKELGAPTTGATNKTDNAKTSVQSIDDAVDMIEKRDKCDTEEASSTAQVEFPELFKVK